MAVESKEVSKFTSGLIGSTSETDLGDDFATFSLNVDSEQEKGALRGIKGDLILGEEGWVLPRKATWRMRFTSNTASDYTRKAFLIYGYNKTFCVYMVNSSAAAESHMSDRATEMGWELVTVDIGTVNNNTQFINKIATSLETLSPSVTMTRASGIGYYFTAKGVTDINAQNYLVIQSNFTGHFKLPESPGELAWTYDSTDTDKRTDTFTDETLNTVLIYYPDSVKYSGHAGWNAGGTLDIDGKFIRGTGIIPDSPSEDAPLGFKFLKSMNEKGNTHIFSITSSAKAILLANIGKDSFALQDLGPVSTSNDSFDITAEQRNTNLYVGTGNSPGTQSLWFGKVDRKQLENTFVSEYFLSESNLSTLSGHYGPISVDNLVVPTLHYGLNSTNFGIAGSANIYAQSNGDDLFSNNIANRKMRTVNNWARQCLKNVNATGTAYDNYDDFKLGMIFRLDIGGNNNFVASNNTQLGLITSGGSTTTGANAFTHLSKLKGFAKGKLNVYDENGEDNTSGTLEGSNDELLHDGDLFQIVHVPAPNSLDENAIETDNDLIRFAYIGHLRGDQKISTTTSASAHDSNICFDGIPAYSFGHVNDSNELYRIRNTSRNDDFFRDNDNSIDVYDSTGNALISQEKALVQKIDLITELEVENFQIGTIAECKSVDGEGGFGGDTTNKNYYMGYGKLWISNRNEYNKLYLVDVSNWDLIDADRPKISFKEVELSFDRIHDHLFATDYTEYGKGLVRLWYKGYGTDDYDDLIGDYQWINEPNNQYISGICETHSHKPHLADGATAGVGNGKWRVWVTYNKENNITHDRWDLFLFNFRPQGIESSSPADTQDGIGTNTNYTVYMYDKTPPYQEVAYLKVATKKNNEGNDLNKIFYPYDKFSMSHTSDHPPTDTYENLSNDGAESSNSRGAEWFGITGGSNRKSHFMNVEDSQDLLNFRNPSGEFMTWKVFYGSTVDDNSHVFSMGNNLGWSVKSNKYRKWTNFRHCLKPHFKEWYFTGTGDKDSTTELTKPVAHIVSFFGKLSGDFCVDGGQLVMKKSSGDVSWYSRKEGILESYDNDIVMFSMHDSPVAFCDTTGSGATKTARFNSGEIQGAPYGRVNDAATLISDASIGGPVTGGDTTDAKFKDTEAGWRTDASVPATIGYSRFNQYRHHHDFNGSADLNLDTGFDGDVEDRHGYCDTRFSSTQDGGQYYGQDGFGHYNMITTTWASNNEILGMTKSATNDINSGVFWNQVPHPTGAASRYNDHNDHFRIFGTGLEKFAQIWRSPNGDEGDESGFTGWYRPRTGHFQSGVFHKNIDKMAETRFGTGYLTYRWPHTEDPSLAGSGGRGDDHGDYASHRAGYYSDDAITIPKDGQDPTGGKWDNRKTVWCWSTTCLTESIYKSVDYSKGTHDMINDWEVLISPRCSFRKVTLPDGAAFDDIRNVDFISWQKIDYSDDTNSTRHGYIISGEAKNSSINNADQSVTLCAVIDNKAINEYSKEGWGVHNSIENDHISWYKAQSKAAVSNLTPLIKQHKKYYPDYIYQFASYTNNQIIFKNLNPGLSDCSTEYDYWDRTFHGDDSSTTKELRLEPYSPIIVGNSGGTGMETISNWIRPQFVGSSNVSMNSMGDFPCYAYDKFWNFWSTDPRSPNNADPDEGNYTDYSTEGGFDNSVIIYQATSDEPAGTISANKRPTEGIGSTAGSLNSKVYNYTNPDGKYPSGSDTTGYDHSSNNVSVTGGHSKLKKDELLLKISEEPADIIDATVTPNIKGGVEFKENSIAYYKFSYTYDGFQEGPLSSSTFDIEVDGDSKFLRLLLALPTAAQLGLNPRITHLNIYRKNDLKSLFRLVKQINLNGIESKFQLVNGVFQHKFNDEGTTVSYEGLNGVSETLTKFTPNYALSCQLNDFLFVAKIHHPELDQGDHILLRSKKGKFSVFDWSNDFLDLPTQPIAMASFANRVFLWDENNTYIINPMDLYIEERVEGVGILNSRSYVVTDIGLFFADRNNIYVHDGKNATPIGDPILRNQSRPEWQIGYLDAIKKSESLGYTPKVIFDSVKQSLYVILQGFNDADTQDFGTSYKTYESRLYSFNINEKRWDYYDCPNVKSAVVTGKGDVILTDGFSIYNYRTDKRNRKSFTWESKEFIMGSSNYDKSFKRLYITGEVCMYKFNNSQQTFATATNDSAAGDDWGGGNYQQGEGIDFTVGNDTHLLETSPASRDDDIQVYVDGVLKTMKVQDRKPHVGHYLANDKTGSIYTVETHLPAFETGNNSLVDPDGNPLLDSFSINISSIPEFIESPNSQYSKVTKQGEFTELVHIHPGQYLYFSGEDSSGDKLEEFVKVKRLFFNWVQDENGDNEISTATSVRVSVFRGLLGTKAINWHEEATNAGNAYGETMNPIRIASPVLKFPSGTKGKNVKVVMKNQKSYIDSFAVTYRKGRMK